MSFTINALLERGIGRLERAEQLDPVADRAAGLLTRVLAAQPVRTTQIGQVRSRRHGGEKSRFGYRPERGFVMSTNVSRTFQVQPPPALVLAYLKDFGHAEQWDPGTESCRRSDSGPIEVGASWHNKSRIAGLETELTYTLERLTADTIVLVGRNQSATSTDTITVRECESGSEITYRAEIEMHGSGAKLASPLVKLVFEKLGHDTERQLTGVLNAL